MTHTARAQRPMRPVVVMLFGALGDLALERIVKALFSYDHSTTERPLAKLLLCDLVADDAVAIATTLAERAIGKHSTYFQETFVRRHISAGGMLSDAGKAFIRTTDDPDSWLTKPGRFLLEHYVCTADNDYRNLSSNVRDCDVLCYVATPPAAYRSICESLATITGSTAANAPRTVVVLEKPFAAAAGDARALRDVLQTLSTQAPNLLAFGAEHYFAKPTVRALANAMRTNPAIQDAVGSARRIEVRLLEAQDIPVHRLRFMSSVGLFGDMAPHVLALVQLLFSEAEITITKAELVRVASYPGYSDQVRRLPEPDTRLYDTAFEVKLTVATPRGEVELILESGKSRVDCKQIRLDGELALDLNTKSFGPALPVPTAVTEPLARELDAYDRILRDALDVFRHPEENLPQQVGLALRDIDTAAGVAIQMDLLRTLCGYPGPGEVPRA